MKKLLSMISSCMCALVVLNSCNTLNQQERQLFDAIQSGDVKNTEQLLDQGVNIEAFTRFTSPSEFFKAKEQGERAVTDLDNRSRATPLCWAANFGQAKVAKLLISRGAKVNTKNAHHVTPLMLSAMSPDAETGKILIQHGANIEAVDKEGNNALLHCAKYNNLALTKVLCQQGANMYVWNKKAYSAFELAIKLHHQEIFHYYISIGYNINRPDKRYFITPLMLAIQYNNTDAAITLIRLGADIHATDGEGFNAIDAARDFKRPEMYRLLYNCGLRNTPPKYRDSFGIIHKSSPSQGGSSGGTCTSCNGVGTYQHGDGSCHPCSSCGGSGRRN